ncbi:hypothetical protein M3J09_000006 [Ascochyta lentis]
MPKANHCWNFDGNLARLNDVISSIKPDAGQWTFYSDPNCQGNSIQISGPTDYSVMKGNNMNDAISSVSVIEP